MSPEIPPRSIKRCVFTHKVFHNVDDTLASLYKSYGKRCPFGDFRASWWRYHCQQMGGPGYCPYQERDCALAFFRVASLCVKADKPGAMFRVVAKDHAMKRLERKPLTRDTESRSPFTRTDPGAVAGSARQGDDQGPDPGLSRSAEFTDEENMAPVRQDGPPLRRTLTRPVRLGTLLGSLDSRSREMPAEDGREGPAQREAPGESL